MNTNSVWLARVFCVLTISIMIHAFIFGQYYSKGIALPSIVADVIIPHSREAILDPKQVECLQQNIYFEARNQSIIGQALVGLTVINRKSHGFADSLCEVVFAPFQYSWTIKSKSLPTLKTDLDKMAWTRAGIIAKFLMRHPIDNELNSVVNYHKTSIRPFWMKDKHLVAFCTIEDHLFYKRKNI